MKNEKIYWIIFSFLLVCSSCAPRVTAEFQARNGELDLRNLDWDTSGPVNLSGEWKYIKNRESSAFTEPGFDDSSWDTFVMPGFWNGIFEWPNGYCYYRLKVHLASPGRKMGLLIDKIESAYALHLNSKLVVQQGTPGNSKATTVPHQLPVLKAIDSSAEMTFVLKISSFHDVFGGTKESPRLGLYEDLVREKYRSDFSSSTILGIFVIISIYHFFLWLRMRKNTINLAFSIFTFSLACYVFFFDNLFTQLMPIESLFWYILILKAKYISMLLACIFGPRFFYAQYSREFSKKVLVVLQGISCLFCMIVMFTPPEIFSALFYFYMAHLLVICFWLLYSLIITWIKKRNNSILFFCGFSFLTLTVINDVLFEAGLISTGTFVPLGMVVFIMIQSLILSGKFIQALKQSEYLGQNLQQEVTKKTFLLKKQKEQLEKAYADLKRSEDSKNSIFQKISHELRTPLTLILAPLASIREEELQNLTDKGQDFLDIIHRNAGQLDILISQLIDLTRIEVGKEQLIPETTSLLTLVRDVVTLFGGTGSVQRLNLEYDDELENLFLELDQDKMIKVFCNLITNALKFSKAPSPVDIILSLNTREDPLHREVRITVRDYGIVIPKEKLPFIFERFYQVDDTPSRRHEGLGIGLSLVYEYVKMHRGQIDVESEHGQTSFTITLPADVQEPAGRTIQLTDNRTPEQKTAVIPSSRKTMPVSGEKGSYDPHNKSATVLLVEDNRDYRKYLVMHLRQCYKVLEAENGKEGLEIISGYPVDLVIADVMMPGMDGHTMFERISENPLLKRIPFIFLTARSGQEEKLKALEKGALDYISKPFDIKILLAKIRSILENQKNVSTGIRQKVMNRLQDFLNTDQQSGFEKIFRSFNLTPRESEVAQLLLQGLQYKEIAVELDLHASGAKKHILNIYKKFRVNRYADFILMVHRRENSST